MDKKAFEALIKNRENKDLDFKLELPGSEKVANLVTAFYNSRGGTIVLGVEDETRKPVGLRDAKKTEHRFIQIIRHWCKLDKDPEIEFVKYQNKEFIVITCPKGEDTPYFIRGQSKPRVRVGSSNVVANKEETARLYREGSSTSQDVSSVANTDLDDLDLKKIKEYFRRSVLTKKLDDKHIRELMLKEHFVVEENNSLVPTIAGILLFGKNPHLNITQCEIRADRYVGESMVEWIDRKDVHGTLFGMLKQAERFILKNMRTPATVVGFKTEFRTEYPIEALREAIVNALVHRDWNSSEAILVRMFDSHVDILSPGELLRPLTLRNIKRDDYIPCTRNKILVEVLAKFGIMDKRGTGFLRIRQALDKWKLPHPSFEERQGWFVISFRNPMIIKIPEMKVPLNERQRKAINYLKMEGTMTRKIYCDLNKISSTYAKKELKELQKKKIIGRFGRGKNTYYKLVSE